MARVTSSALSRTDCRRASPSALRSSVTRPIPAATASRTERGRSGVIVPLVKGAAPNIALASDERPEPCRPATPTISPALSSSVMSSRRSLPPPVTLSRTSPTEEARGGK